MSTTSLDIYGYKPAWNWSEGTLCEIDQFRGMRVQRKADLTEEYNPDPKAGELCYSFALQELRIDTKPAQVVIVSSLLEHMQMFYFIVEGNINYRLYGCQLKSCCGIYLLSQHSHVHEGKASKGHIDTMKWAIEYANSHLYTMVMYTNTDSQPAQEQALTYLKFNKVNSFQSRRTRANIGTWMRDTKPIEGI